ncbi:MAG TPA: GntR family transcriptional regulator [Anaerolineaceae bacterium]|nr:GntR family transcriptional regulator [Anaerolineaceae bacterium]
MSDFEFSKLQDSIENVPQRAYEYLKLLINNNSLKIGTRLPSEQELTEKLNISRSSLRIALSRLEVEGFIKRRHGVGTFITGNAKTLMPVRIEYSFSITDYIKSCGKIPGTSEFNLERINADTDLSNKLSVELNSPVIKISRLRTSDGVPFSYDINLIPSKYLPQKISRKIIGESLFTFIERNIDPKICYFSTSYKPLISDEFISKKLAIKKGTPIIKNTQVHYSEETKPLWCLEIWIQEYVGVLHYISPPNKTIET